MKNYLLLTILSVVLTIPAFAQDKESDIKHLLKLTSSEQISESMMNSMLPVMKMQFSEKIKNSSDREKFEGKMDSMMAATITEVKELTNKLNNVEMVNIYDKHFTHEEIKDLITFYESPVGKKILEKNPEITSELMNIMMTKYMPDFQDSINKRLEAIK